MEERERGLGRKGGNGGGDWPLVGLMKRGGGGRFDDAKQGHIREVNSGS